MLHSDWQEMLCVEQNPGPCVFVIFGASGDLARRKLFPSLFTLFQRGLFGNETRMLGCARHPHTDDSFRESIAGAFDGARPETRQLFLSRVHYQPLDYAVPETYAALRDRLDALDREAGAPLPRLFYLAVPATLYPAIVRQLAGAGLLREEKQEIWRHVVFEKPFGFDRASAASLDSSLHEFLGERQIYRIDHYLGKETVQNIFLFRFANLIFEPVWNARYIDNVQITVSETLGVENRAGYFDQAGILRDMFQNHMLEMLSLVAMECPVAFEADDVRDEKLKLIRSIRPLDVRTGQGIVRAQYAGYRAEPGVAPDSATETYAALRLAIDNWRWKGVPFYLRAGKRLARRTSEIDVTFKAVPHSVFPGIRADDLQRDILHLRVQPEEGISLTIQAKKAGPKLCMGALTLNYNYSEAGVDPLDAYARLLLDCCLGDQTLFIRSDVIGAAWGLYQPLLDFWRANPGLVPLRTYSAGGRGPAEADSLLSADGRRWND